MRAFDKWQPFPEEINRRVASVIADLHFAPTGTARKNLRKEGVPDSHIRVTGNPVIDAIHWVAKQPLTPEAHAIKTGYDQLKAIPHDFIRFLHHEQIIRLRRLQSRNYGKSI